jgi:ubiquinone/menaquinone biosynthesis C-methylase UbiE
MSEAAPPPDFEAVKAQQKAAWSSGDYGLIANRVAIVSEVLCDRADIVAGSRVLDVAGGAGYTAMAAARCGAEVTSIDYVPELVARGREIADAARFDNIDWVVGDAENLPFEDASFDAVISALGVMFAPNHERAASELVRVCRPGGIVAIASWSPEGFVGRMFRTIGRHVPPPAGVKPPPLWGSEEHVRALLGDRVDDLRAEQHTMSQRFRSPQEFVDLFRDFYGPIVKAFEALDDAGKESLEAELLELAREFDRRKDGGAIAIEAEYLVVIATRAG